MPVRVKEGGGESYSTHSIQTRPRCLPGNHSHWATGKHVAVVLAELAINELRTRQEWHGWARGTLCHHWLIWFENVKKKKYNVKWTFGLVMRKRCGDVQYLEISWIENVWFCLSKRNRQNLAPLTSFHIQSSGAWAYSMGGRGLQKQEGARWATAMANRSRFLPDSALCRPRQITEGYSLCVVLYWLRLRYHLGLM